MQTSKIAICNLALAAIGEDSIRDFAEGNKRARMCDVFYDMTRDHLLSQFDWAFARRQIELKELSTPQDWVPEDMKVYGVPADCHKILDLWPEGCRESYEVRGSELYTRKESPVLMYTQYIINPTKFSAEFINLLAVALSVRICLPIAQDKELAKTLYGQYKTEMKEAWASDAVIGGKHLHNDANPNYDSFVDPDYSFTEFNMGDY